MLERCRSRPRCSADGCCCARLAASTDKISFLKRCPSPSARISVSSTPKTHLRLCWPIPSCLLLFVRITWPLPRPKLESFATRNCSLSAEFHIFVFKDVFCFLIVLQLPLIVANRSSFTVSLLFQRIFYFPPSHFLLWVRNNRRKNKSTMQFDNKQTFIIA